MLFLGGIIGAQYMYTLLLLFKGHNYAFPGRYRCGAVHVYTVVAIEGHTYAFPGRYHCGCRDRALEHSQTSCIEDTYVSWSRTKMVNVT